MGLGTETLTDFLHKPAGFLKRVDKADVVLRRRGKPAIRLALESRRVSSGVGAEIAARLLAEAMVAIPEMRTRMPQILEHQYPWVHFLPADGRAAFAREFIATMHACAAIGTPARLDEVLHSWKATAAIYSDPALATDLLRPLPVAAGRRVPRPSGR